MHAIAADVCNCAAIAVGIANPDPDGLAERAPGSELPGDVAKSLAPLRTIDAVQAHPG